MHVVALLRVFQAVGAFSLDCSHRGLILLQLIVEYFCSISAAPQAVNPRLIQVQCTVSCNIATLLNSILCLQVNRNPA